MTPCAVKHHAHDHVAATCPAVKSPLLSTVEAVAPSNGVSAMLYVTLDPGTKSRFVFSWNSEPGLIRTTFLGKRGFRSDNGSRTWISTSSWNSRSRSSWNWLAPSTEAVIAILNLTTTLPAFLATNLTTPELTLLTEFLWNTLTTSPISWLERLQWKWSAGRADPKLNAFWKWCLKILIEGVHWLVFNLTKFGFSSCTIYK